MFGNVGTLEGIEQIRRDLESLFEWSETWQMNFNLAKCIVMHIGGKNTEAYWVVRG